MKFLPLWFSMTALLGAETLEVLVLEVDKRLAEPTLARFARQGPRRAG